MVVHLLCAMLLLIGVSFFYLTESKFRIFIGVVILAAIVASYCGLYPENIACDVAYVVVAQLYGRIDWFPLLSPFCKILQQGDGFPQFGTKIE